MLRHGTDVISLNIVSYFRKIVIIFTQQTLYLMKLTLAGEILLMNLFFYKEID